MASFTLSLRVESAENLSTHASAAFCALLLWSSSPEGGPGKPTSQPKYTSFSHVRENEAVEWKEQVEVDAADPKSEVLTVRVKDSSDALVGSCNIYLAHLQPGKPLDQWFQLHPSGHVRLKLELKPTLQSTTTPVNDFQALFQLEMEKAAAMMQQSAFTPNVATMLEAQNKAQENARLMIAQHLQLQQQSAAILMQTQSLNAGGFPGFPPQQQPNSGSNFHEMMGTAANMSTFATNMQQLNGDSTGFGTGALGTVASVGLGALGLGPFGAFFGS